MDITNQQTMGNNSKFPGLSQKQIEKLEEMTANYTGLQKQQIQQQVYQQTLQQMKQQQTKDERFQTENELYQKSLDEKDPKQQNYLQSNVRLEQLADMVKEKYNLKADADTNGVIGCLIQEAQDKGVSIESLNNYLESGDEKFLYDVGLKEQGFWSKVGQVGTDIVGGALATASALPELAASGLATGIGGVAKFFGADEDKVDYYVNDFKQHLEDDSNSKLIGANPESIAFNIPKGIGDLAQVAVGEGLVKGAIQGTAKGANLLNKIKNAPTRGKMIANGIEGAGDMALYSIIADNKLPSREEEGVGAALGAAFPMFGAIGKATKNALKKGAAKLELNGLLNPAKLETVRTQMISEGAKLPGKGTAEDVGKWMVERGFKGTKDEIVSQLKAHSDKAKGLVDDLLATSTTQHKVPEVNEALKMLYEDYSKTPGLKDKANEIASMMKDTYTISEMNKVKRYMDDAFNMFKMNGGETAGLKSEGLRNIRQGIKNKIEDVAESEGLGNIKLLNNETQVARGLLDGITKKESAASVRELLSPFQSGTMGSIIGGIGGGVGYGDTWEQKLKGIVLGAIGGKLLGSTSIKTKLANMIGKLGGVEKKELTEYIASNGQKALSEKGEQALLKIAGENKEIATEIKQEVEKEAQKQIGKEANNIDNVVNDNMLTKTDEIVENADNVVNKTESIVKQEEKVADQVENTVNKSEDVVQKAEQTVQNEESALVEDMKKHSREENERALRHIQDYIKREKDVINNFENYKKVGQITDETDPRRQGHLETYNKLKEQESLFKDYLENTVKKAETPKKSTKKTKKTKETTKELTKDEEQAIRDKYEKIFREKFNIKGDAIPYDLMISPEFQKIQKQMEIELGERTARGKLKEETITKRNKEFLEKKKKLGMDTTNSISMYK